MTAVRRLAARTIVVAVFLVFGAASILIPNHDRSRPAEPRTPTASTDVPEGDVDYQVQVDPKARQEAIAELEDHQSWCHFESEEDDVRGKEWNGISCTDWKNVKVPGSACGVSREVQLKDGEAIIASPRFPEYDKVAIRVSVTAFDDGVVYGDLDNDGLDEAAVSVWCHNRGGTAAGQVGQEWVVFTDARAPRAIGSVAPQHGNDGRNHIPYIGRSIFMAPGRIVAEESFYRGRDATCCPTGRAITTWSYSNGRLSVLESKVVSEPRP